jgi:hypothetical protein
MSKSTIYLVASRAGVLRMTKSLPTVHRDEIAIKVEVTIDPDAFAEPVLVRHIRVSNPWEGVDVADLDLKTSVITEEEAQAIIARRLAKMQEILTDRGYGVTPPDEEESDG